ncbi:MAG TPA: hydantoinase/oxoprolinase family protein [Candidatus Limnocylindria bacterium]|nr:hydantoinase/oxoprolinase family protein [Candidatus Limnocylindria bacterium]
MRLGIDVGGTNTDAVVMHGTTVAGAAKVTTSADVTSGLATAAREALAASQLDPADVRAAMVGTTHFTNALVERRGLLPTAIVRLGLPATTSVSPFADWPADLVTAIGGMARLAHGGHEFDGREIAPLDPDELRAIGRELRAAGVRAVAVVGVFSPVVAAHEERAAAILAEELPEASLSLSHEVGRLGLLERENATALNACLVALASRVIGGIGDALRDVTPSARLFLTQNDGTLLPAEVARRHPVRTIASGPTNSMRGAAFLSGIRDGIVIDIGGTTTDVGVIANGFPREAGIAVRVAGVRTNFRMPDVLSIGLGGGSLVEAAAVGPRSVGAALTREARVFGGATLTATDVAVATGRAHLGERTRVVDVDPELVRGALEAIDATLADAIDRVKTARGDVPVVLVGGGSILAAETLPGASRVDRPAHHAVANAIGAAIAEVSGEVDRVFSLDGEGARGRVLAAAREEAVARAIDAGADPGAVDLVEIEEVPLTYLPSNAVRVHVKVVGALRDG